MRAFAWMMAACCLPAQAVPAPAPSLDLVIAYYSKTLTPEGVTREASYRETMMRRPGHVWVARSIAAGAAPAPAKAGHAEFNPALLPRHVTLDQGQLRVSYVDRRARELIAIPPSEYGNVNFDGSWENAYFLLDPARVKTLPLSARPSPVAGAHWHERERKGMFERVLWDEARQIPLRIESGDLAATFLNRVEVSVQAALAPSLPWQKLQGYAQKEYADFLD